MAHRNANKEDEWPNYEFYYKDFDNSGVAPSKILGFKKSIDEIIREKELDPNIQVLELFYRKKALPAMNNFPMG